MHPFNDSQIIIQTSYLSMDMDFIVNRFSDTVPHWVAFIWVEPFRFYSRDIIVIDIFSDIIELAAGWVYKELSIVDANNSYRVLYWPIFRKYLWAMS